MGDLVNKNINDKKDFIVRIVRFFLKLFRLKNNNKLEKLLVQIFKFAIVGVVATIIDFIFLYIFRDICNLPLIVSNTLSFTISVIYNYFASMRFVFDVNKEKSKFKSFVIFIICSVIGLILNDIIVIIVTNKLKVHYLFSKVLATIIVMVFNFVTRKKFLE